VPASRSPVGFNPVMQLLRMSDVGIVASYPVYYGDACFWSQ
jgi:hypothetical protein